MGGAANLWLSELVTASPRGLPAQGQSTENPAHLRAGKGPGPLSLLQLQKTHFLFCRLKTPAVALSASINGENSGPAGELSGSY